MRNRFIRESNLRGSGKNGEKSVDENDALAGRTNGNRAVLGKADRFERYVVDLFCGAGGLTKGLELAGFEGICGLDWFQEAGETYARNFDHPFVDGDIKLQEVKDRFYETVRERLNGRKLTLVAGGFPC